MGIGILQALRCKHHNFVDAIKRRRTSSATSTSSTTMHNSEDMNDDKERSHHVRFPNKLVTSTTYRPSTTPEEKSNLYYTPQDYEFFALEEHYYQMDMMDAARHHEQSFRLHSKEVFSWEDCIVYENVYDSSDDIHHADSMDESTQTALEEGGATYIYECGHRRVMIHGGF